MSKRDKDEPEIMEDDFKREVGSILKASKFIRAKQRLSIARDKDEDLEIRRDSLEEAYDLLDDIEELADSEEDDSVDSSDGDKEPPTSVDRYSRKNKSLDT